MYRGYGGYGYQGFGDVASDAATLFAQIQSGDTTGAVTALQAMDANTKSQVCMQMGALATTADAQAASASGVLSYQNEAAVVAACTAAGVTMPAAPGSGAALYAQLKTGDQAGVLAQLNLMSPSDKQTACMQMGTLAEADDMAIAQSTSTVAYTNQNAVIDTCVKAGLKMPAPGGTPAPAPTPVQQAGIGTVGWVVGGLAVAGLLWWALSSAPAAAAV